MAVSTHMRSCLAALFLVTLVLSPALCRAADLDGFEDEDSGRDRPSSGFRKANLGEQAPGQDSEQAASGDPSSDADVNAAYIPPPDAPRPELPFPMNLLVKLFPSGPPAPVDMRMEGALGSFFVLYLINLFVGRRRNRAMGAAFTRLFATSGGAQLPCSLPRQFSVVLGEGSKTGPLLVESMSMFKLYATGRRHCQFMVATLNLRARQDLISQVWYLAQPAEDTLHIEVAVAPSVMPPLVMAVGTPRVARRFATELKDVSAFTHRITANAQNLPNWSERIHILAEHSAVAYDLLADPQVIALLAADDAGPRLFRGFHFSSELTTSIAGAAAAAESGDPGPGPTGPPSNLPAGTQCALRFQFAIPSPDNMESLAGLMALVPLFIDAVGAYKPATDLRRKLIDQRQKNEERATKEKVVVEERAAKIREEKFEAEKEKRARMTPENRAKALEKQDRVDRKKMLKRMTRKV